MEELIPVTLWLAGRGYRIRIKKQDEEGIRLAAKIADERVNELRNSYSGKDDQDFLAMCLLMYATDQVTEANQLNPVQQDAVQQMIEQIDKINE
jgi:cell division protein ZapA